MLFLLNNMGRPTPPQNPEEELPPLTVIGSRTITRATPRRTERKFARRSITVRDSHGKIKTVPFVEVFASEYLRNGGNATRAYIRFNPNATLTAASAAGSYWLAQAKKMGLYRQVVERSGYTFPKMINHALEKMGTSNKPDWWDRVMKLSGYEDFTPSGNQSVTVNTNVFEAHRGMKEEYVEGEIVEEKTEELDPEN